MSLRDEILAGGFDSTYRHSIGVRFCNSVRFRILN